MLNSKIDIGFWNRELRDSKPYEIIDWALQLTDKRIVTTSFGRYSAVLLNSFYEKEPNIDFIWCDTGFNIPETYEHALELMERLNLNIHTYVPKQTRAFVEATLGLPEIGTPEHAKFSEIVKLEPFRRALAEHQPELWFTNIRIRQTELRKSKNILSFTKDGILKVSPYYYHTDDDLDYYLDAKNLPKNSTYFDPIKALENRECGIHLL